MWLYYKKIKEIFNYNVHLNAKMSSKESYTEENS